MAAPMRLCFVASNLRLCLNASSAIRFTPPFYESFSQKIVIVPSNVKRSIFSSARLSAASPATHSTVMQSVQVLDESDKEVGVMKWNRLKVMAIEQNLKILCVDEKAQPHPIYKIVSNKAFLEHERKNKKVKNVAFKAKSVAINSVISPNDLSRKVGDVVEWLGKNYTVKVRIDFRHPPNEKKHLEVYKEIMKAAQSLSTMKSSMTTARHMTFELQSLSLETTQTPIPDPLSIDELKSSRTFVDSELADADDKQSKKEGKAVRAAKGKSQVDEAEPQADDEVKSSAKESKKTKGQKDKSNSKD